MTNNHQFKFQRTGYQVNINPIYKGVIERLTFDYVSNCIVYKMGLKY